jgi:hypothetical protein
MTCFKAWLHSSDCSGLHPIGWRQAVHAVGYALLMLPMLVGQGFAQGGLQGRYLGNGLEVTFSKDKAEITYAGHLCIGHLEGHVEKRSTGLFIVGENCEISLSLGDDDGLDLDQGTGCSKYHGASCSLSGHVYPDR